MSAFICLHEGDGVVIARITLMPGTEIAPGVQIVERIPAGHKAAVRAHAPGEPVRRYGQVIGLATQAIPAGVHVHTHNIGMGDYDHDYAWGVDSKPTPHANRERSFLGIRRPDGRVATRNYIGILTSGELLRPHRRPHRRPVQAATPSPAPTRWPTTPTWTASSPSPTRPGAA